MVPFKIGDFVRHRMDGERLRIKRISETVASCEEIDKGKIEINIKGEYVYPVRISHVENLILDKKICWKCGQLYIGYNKHPHKNDTPSTK